MSGSKFQASSFFFESERAITGEKLLSKICFAKYGTGLREAGPKLMEDMLHHLRGLANPPISRQTISFWFRKKDPTDPTSKGPSVPSRNNGLIFLSSFISREINLEGGTTEIGERKKVKTQLERFMLQSINFSNTNLITRGMAENLTGRNALEVLKDGDNHIVIRLGEAIDHEAYQPILGAFELYRRRFSTNKKSPYARELVYVYRRRAEVRFRHWYLHEGEELAKFEGLVSIIGHSLWFISSSQRDENRLRIMKFRYVKSPAKALRDLKWGIMMTDTPNSSAFDPVATRVLLLRSAQRVDNMDILARSIVKNIAGVEINSQIRDIILRMIDNNSTSSSLPGTTDPVKSSLGKEFTDTVLKVNQDTLEAAAFSISDDGYSAPS